jgi:hypothetical protein
MSPETALPVKPEAATEPRFEKPSIDPHADRAEPTAPYAPLGVPEFWPER